MRLLFLTMGQLQNSPAGPTSPLASTRYRVIIPAQQLARLGHEVRIQTVEPGGAAKLDHGFEPEAVVVSKSFHSATEEVAKAARARGARIVADFCDDHFEHPEHGAHYRRLAELAEHRVASTPAMAEVIRLQTGLNATVIGDPVEGPRGMPMFAPRFPALRIAWFGHPSNLTGLAKKAGELRALAAHMPIHLSVVTTQCKEVIALLTSLANGWGDRVQVELFQWTLETTWKAIEQADLVWIPVDEGNATKAVKSPNRLLEPLWAGRLTVADRVPSYQDFADLMPIGVGLERAVREALTDPAGVEAKLRECQRRIGRWYSTFACGNEWARVLGDTAQRPLRLNLGCGDKILQGYVNVDVVQSRAGKKPDVICDLHDLAPFADNSADEILSVHVVEHFWRWEIRDVLREWIRVLKPGGRMIVECPNLLSACQTFMRNPQEFSREDKKGQRTMWVFYGDPAWKDPLMIHRWGYTPQSLAELLQEAGLADIRQEPAQFKLREPRDMRIVATKPAVAVAGEADDSRLLRVVS